MAGSDSKSISGWEALPGEIVNLEKNAGWSLGKALLRELYWPENLQLQGMRVCLGHTKQVSFGLLPTGKLPTEMGLSLSSWGWQLQEAPTPIHLPRLTQARAQSNSCLARCRQGGACVQT